MRVETFRRCSYLDDQLKQEIPVKQCRTLTHIQFETTKSLLVTTRDQIFLLEPLSIKEQIEQLLTAYRLQEALSLAESTCTTVKQKQTSSLVIETKKRIALIEFAAMNVVRALTLFDEIHIDFHEVRFSFDRQSIDPKRSSLDHGANSGVFASADALARVRRAFAQSAPAVAERLRRLCEQEHEFILSAAGSSLSLSFFRRLFVQDFYSALLKAMIITKNRETIVEFVESCAASISLECTALLLDAQLFHGAAVVFARHDQHAEAISIWKK